MANKSLTDLTARTATADSDLIHVNSGGTDYKETKQNFLRGDFAYAFDNTTTLTSQVDALTVGSYFGTIASYGHQSETGVPTNTNYYVQAFVYSATVYRKIILQTLNSDAMYIKYKYSDGSWSDWVETPTRSEITSINNTLAKTYTIHDDFTFTNGACVVSSGNVSSQARMFINQRYAPNGDLSPKIFVSQPQGSSGGFNIYCRYVLTSGGWGAYNGTLPLDVLVINP